MRRTITAGNIQTATAILTQHTPAANKLTRIMVETIHVDRPATLRTPTPRLIEIRRHVDTTHQHAIQTNIKLATNHRTLRRIIRPPTQILPKQALSRTITTNPRIERLTTQYRHATRLPRRRKQPPPNIQEQNIPDSKHAQTITDNTNTKQQSNQPPINVTDTDNHTPTTNATRHTANQPTRGGQNTHTHAHPHRTPCQLRRRGWNRKATFCNAFFGPLEGFSCWVLILLPSGVVGRSMGLLRASYGGGLVWTVCGLP